MRGRPKLWKDSLDAPMLVRCEGRGCPFKEKCIHYTDPGNGVYAQWFAKEPYDPSLQMCEEFLYEKPGGAMSCCPKTKSAPTITIEQVIAIDAAPKPVQPTMARRDLVDEAMAHDERRDNMRMQMHRVQVVAKKAVQKTEDGTPNPRLRHYTPESA